MSKVYEEVQAERRRQEQIWGPQNHNPSAWLMILGEEVGEANKAALEHYFNYKGASLAAYRAELVQVAAVAIAMIESYDRNEAIQIKEGA